ncbi:hypothetical protein EOPP23_15850 [Endozoicomonas sp. OPT23]|uniref:hypothetical protein n=1 Tax=Endozoicomonas sp. OPT23 TaxID=2072845 RepID=UPI00129B53D9|nr:hypothetical protein [Endozoicomonas sp. OPT23]MRI34460.1 hypothetical protein [Endozoicomonas sp. OPT23]
MAEVKNNKNAIIKKLSQQTSSSKPESLIENVVEESVTALQTLQEEQLEWHRSRRKHREKFDRKIFTLLCAQVVFLSVLMVFQGFKPWGFQLDNWVFGFFINGSLIYTYAIIRYIASDLFNGNHELLKPEKISADNL